METINKTDKVLKWIILGLFIAHILTFLMPIFECVYKNSYGNTTETTLYYFYTTFSSLHLSNLFVYATSLILPITALVFLFANFKNSKLFFFGFSVTYLIECIFTIMSLSKSIKNNTSSNYEYTLKYGYHLFTFTVVLLCLTIGVSFIIYLISKNKDSKPEPIQVQQTSDNSQIDTLRKRIDLLDELKEQGILTEREYEQKRAEIIREIKI